MPDHSPELVAFAANLNAHPDDVEEIYQYCLAMVMVEAGQAELVKIELRGREPWCSFKSINGDQFVVLRPVLSQTEEREMMETIWAIFHPGEGPLFTPQPASAPEVNPPVGSAQFEAISSLETRDWEGLVRGGPKRRRRKLATLPPRTLRAQKPAPPPEALAVAPFQNTLTLAAIDEATTVLRQLIEQAQAVMETLGGMLAETRQVSEAAWEATKEHRLVLAEIRTAIRQYERVRHESNLPSRYERLRAEPDLPLRQQPSSERNRQLTLDVLNGMSLNEAGQKYSISPARVKAIYMNQFYRLNHLREKIDLTPEDLLIIKGYQNRTLLTGLRPHAPRIQELLKMMWAHEEG